MECQEERLLPVLPFRHRKQSKGPSRDVADEFWSLPLSQTSSIRRQRQHEAAIFIFSEPCMFSHEFHCL